MLVLLPSPRSRPVWKPWRPGIKVVSVLVAYARDGRTGLFADAGVGKMVLIRELISTTMLPRSSAVSPLRCESSYQTPGVGERTRGG